MAPTTIVIPVPDAEPAVAGWRRALTEDGRAGMPAHVTLIYPFTDASHLEPGRIEQVRAALERFPAFDFQLTAPRRIDNAPNESYVWLAPTPSEPFVELVEALTVAFPEHPPAGIAYALVGPHLTVAASSDEAVLGRVDDQVSRFLPIRARASVARIMEPIDGAWRTHAEIRLGSA